MSQKITPKLNRRKRYLQVAFNGTLEDAEKIISRLPLSDRILVEAGTPLIKRYGEYGIRSLYQSFAQRLSGSGIFPYIVADLKTMDRGETEVAMAAQAGASAAVALGIAPIETLNAFIAACEASGLDAMIDMMNVEYPLSVLRALKKIPPVVIIHRGVDEEKFNREKQIPLHEIRRVKGNYNLMISIAGGDTLREVQRSIFNDSDIVVIWKSVFEETDDTVTLIEGFLKVIK
jgi:bifunctional enzyme Fae/Hps